MTTPTHGPDAATGSPLTFAQAGIVVVFKTELLEAARAIQLALRAWQLANKERTPEAQQALAATVDAAMVAGWKALQDLVTNHSDVILLDSPERLAAAAKQHGANQIPTP